MKEQLSKGRTGSKNPESILYYIFNRGYTFQTVSAGNGVHGN